MKRRFTFLSIILVFASATIVLGQTTVPNGTFETWTDSVTAQSWSSNNYTVGGFLNYNFVHQSPDAHGGTYAAKIETSSIPVLGTMTGIMTLGSYSLLTGISGGVPVSGGKLTTLKGYFKYTPVSGDTMVIILLATKWNGTSRDTLCFNGIIASSTVSTYTLFQISDTSSIAPDSINIILESSYGSAPQIGSSLYVDDLTLEFNPVGITNYANNNMLAVFPNPTTGRVSVLLNGEKNTVNMYNIIGGLIYQENTSSKNVDIDLSSYPDGVYFIEVRNETSKNIQKIILSR
jgi:hypothetical protein